MLNIDSGENWCFLNELLKYTKLDNWQTHDSKEGFGWEVILFFNQYVLLNIRNASETTCHTDETQALKPSKLGKGSIFKMRRNHGQVTNVSIKAMFILKLLECYKI